MRIIIVLLVAAFALAMPASANGKSKKVVVERQVVRVYEPRPAPPPEPLIALSILGTGLVITDNLDVDLFDIEERRRQQFRRDFDRRRAHRGRR